MKKAFLLCLTLMAATFGFAQQQLATLNHNDSITVYYGASALQQAYNASVDGDIVTLSSGTFPAVSINKAITIRGAGMCIDTLTGTIPTTLTGDFIINHPYGTASSHILLEGLRFTGIMFYSTTNYPEFIKCEMAGLRGAEVDSNSNMSHAKVINCIIRELQVSNRYYRWRGYYLEATDYSRHITNSYFINSVVLNIYYYYYHLGYGQQYERYYNTSADNEIGAIGTYNSFTNCIVNLHPAEVQYYSVNNSILYNNVHDSSSAIVYNSIGINNDSSANYFASSIIGSQNLHNYNSFSDVFKYFRGAYTGTPSFELQDNIATTLIGSDSTQIGIYGGFMPFNPRVSGLNIRRIDVARRTTSDGRLAVDIEVVNENTTITE